MTADNRKLFLARLDKDLRGAESPYEFRVVRGAGRHVRYRAVAKSGVWLHRIDPGPFAGLRPFVNGRRIA